MYLVTIAVPIYVRGGERLLASNWKRSLLLLRDSFDGRFGRIQVVAPSLDAPTAKADQPLEAVRPDDELDLFPSFPLGTHPREFWTKHVRAFRHDIAQHLPNADVVHAGFGDVHRPIDFMGFNMGLYAHKPTVFVQETDPLLLPTDQLSHASLRERAKVRAYCTLYERAVRFGVARASLCLLKGNALHARYASYAKNAKSFQDTSFLSSEVLTAERLEQRIAQMLAQPQPLRLVYVGPLEARQGLDESIDALARARSQGARVTLDIIGDGAQRAGLERQAVNLGTSDAVRFLGRRTYGPELISDLAQYDALFFTPTEADSANMIFDGYAAGLPLLGYGIEYVREREAEDGAALSVPLRDPAAAAALLCRLDRDRHQLASLAKRAREAALYHAADAWYRRRAEWTYEAAAAYRPGRHRV